MYFFTILLYQDFVLKVNYKFVLIFGYTSYSCVNVFLINYQSIQLFICYLTNVGLFLYFY